MLLANRTATVALSNGAQAPFEQTPYAFSWALGLSGNGVTDTSTFSDSSRGRVFSKSGNVTYDASVTKYNPYSIKFDGAATTYLQSPSSLNYAFSFPVTPSAGNSRRDLTISFWVYPSSQTSAAPTIISNSTTTSFAANQWAIRYSDSTAGANTFSYWHGSSSTTAARMKTRAIFTPNQWYHVALIRERRFWYLYVNGIRECVYTSTAADSVKAMDSGAAQAVRIGAAGATNTGFSGYIDDVVIDRGVLDLKEEVPTQDMDLLNDPILSQVSLAYKFEGANGLRAIDPEIGPATASFPVSTNTYISTANSKFGGSSLYVGLPPTVSQTVGVRTGTISIGTNQFYIDTWVNLTELAASNAAQYIFDTRPASGGTGIAMWIDDGGTLLSLSANNIISSYTTKIEPGYWFHLALARESNGVGNVAYRVYLNGRLVLEHSDYTNVDFGSPSFSLGGMIFNPGAFSGVGTFRPLLGYMDSFRVTVGNTPHRLPIYNPPNSTRQLLASS